jgi:hypothetical protein
MNDHGREVTAKSGGRREKKARKKRVQVFASMTLSVNGISKLGVYSHARPDIFGDNGGI